MDDTKEKVVKALKDRKDKLNYNVIKNILSELSMNEAYKGIILKLYDKNFLKEIDRPLNEQIFYVIRLMVIFSVKLGYSIETIKWGISVWCLVYEFSDLAEIVKYLNPRIGGKISILHSGVYRAVDDIPNGRLLLTATWKNECTGKILYGVGKDPMKIDLKDSFDDQTYVDIHRYEFLKILSTQPDLDKIEAIWVDHLPLE